MSEWKAVPRYLPWRGRVKCYSCGSYQTSYGTGTQVITAPWGRQTWYAYQCYICGTGWHQIIEEPA